jgi:hypothetical protein
MGGEQMTKKDFELIASTVQELALKPNDKAYVAERFAHRLATENARFDRAKFLRACDRP